MGQKQSKLSNVQIEELIKSTKFDKKELKQWHGGFMKDCPSGKIDRDAFANIYSQFFPTGDTKQFSDYVFRVFDANGDGTIEFSEFIVALSTTSRGDMKDKLRWAFKIYDIDQDGSITREEMLLIITAIYKMTGPMVKFPEDEDTPEKRVDKLFKLMDKDDNGRITLAEFEQGCGEDLKILESLNLYEGVKFCSAQTSTV